MERTIAEPSHAGSLRLLRLTWLASLAYVAAEWLFFVTKPSILSYFSLAEKLSALFLGALLVLAGMLPLLLAAALAARLLENGGTGRGSAAACLPLLAPALLLAATVFLLADNFTYTMFGFNSLSFGWGGRLLYGAAFLLLLGRLVLALRAPPQGGGRDGFANAAALAAGLPALAFAAASLLGAQNYGVAAAGNDGSGLPNILILSSDGVEASHMSAYGYPHQTTPFIAGLAAESLLFENHFSNAANTTGSVTSLLTGKLPTTTRVIYPPDTLAGADAFQHLPGILRGLGYRNGDISIRFYADSQDLNLQQGFHYANGRRMRDEGLSGELFSALRRWFPQESLFLRRSYGRISDRMFHLAGLIEPANPFEMVTVPETQAAGVDDRRIESMMDFIATAGEPFFLHVHLLGTHGPKFQPRNRLRSDGMNQDANFMEEFYDDAMRDFDDYVKRTVAFLKERGLYENTLLILNTDHGIASSANSPLPLLMKFPRAELAGRRSAPSQRIDIAPTILDFLGIAVPDWMEGESLLGLAGDRNRPIFASWSAAASLNVSGAYEVLGLEPPFFTLGRFSLVHCHLLFYLDLSTLRLDRSPIDGHTRPCRRQDSLSTGEAAELMLAHLAERGYAVEGLELDYIPDRLTRFNGRLPVLAEEGLYIPDIEYQEERFAVFLRRNEEDERIFSVSESAPPIEGAAQAARFDMQAGVLEITRLDGVESDLPLRFALMAEGPLTFRLLE